MDIQQKFSEVIADQFKNGYAEELVEKYAKEALEKQIEELFSYFGKGSKQIEEWLKENFKLNFDSISLPEYNDFVISTIESCLGEVLQTQSIKPIRKAINQKIQVLEKDHYKLSEIVNKLKEYWYEDDGEGECTCEVRESDYGYKYIHLDSDDNKSHYQCDIQISLDKNNEVWNFHNNDCNSSMKNPPIGLIDTFLFQLFANRVTIEIDDVETEYYRY